MAKKEEFTKPLERRNNLQLRLSKQNELLAERLMLKWQLEKGKNVNWTWFGNHLIMLGIKALNKEIIGSMSRRDKMSHLMGDLKND
jgi:hypothetical protein